jgi:glycosyltransferase involved in cell wall biosynthesis
MADEAGMAKPRVSVVVVVYNIPREAPRTLYSLSAEYQRDIAADDYEVIVVDNGSNPPFDADVLEGLSGNFRLIRLDPAPPSPARAINVGLAAARGHTIGVMIDGARMVTPGLLHFASAGVGLYPRAVVSGLGWYLGLDQQRWALECRYDRAREDALLSSIGWPADGYRLFEIAALDETSIDGWFGTIVESNGLFLSRDSWDFMSGVDERFDAPGGGFLNLDIIIRACEFPDSRLVILLGEGTFHQLHGGIATNARPDAIHDAVATWRAQYEAIRGRPWQTPAPAHRTYLGVLPPAALAHFARAIVEPVAGAPLGASFDRTTWSIGPSPRPADATAAALLDLAESAFRGRRFEASATVARMARRHAPDEPGPQRLLAHAGAWLRGPGIPPPERRAVFHLARAKAYDLMGDTAAAESKYNDALTFDPDLADAQAGLSALRIPMEGARAAKQRRVGMPDHARDLYLDLILRILTNTIYGDPSTNPANTGPYKSDLREAGRDWPAVAHTMVGMHRLQNVRDLAQRALDEEVAGNLIEAGVWRGGCCILMRAVLAANGVNDRKVYVADSFAGLPAPNADAFPADAGWDLRRHKELSVSLAEVKDNFNRYGLLDDQVVFVEGWFSETLPTLDAGPFALIRLDGDLYESTYVSLDALYPKLSPGGFIVIDDLYFLPPCQQAVADYRSRFGITAPMQKVDWNAGWWRKE